MHFEEHQYHTEKVHHKQRMPIRIFILSKSFIIFNQTFKNLIIYFELTKHSKLLLWYGNYIHSSRSL